MMRRFIFMGLITLLTTVLYACSQEPIETQPPSLSSEWSDNLDLQPVQYEGREFIRDGIGEVQLSACVDGDTSIFTYGTASPFRVRYLGIDTREMTSKVEPWGRPAGDYVCEYLTNAETIVLEMDDSAGKFDNYGRYLAYVWVDGKLLNLMIVEQAYAPAVGTGSLRYGNELLAAQTNARATGLRIWGETDPSFIGEPLDLTMEELLSDLEAYKDRFVNVTGIVTRRSNQDFFFGTEDDDIFVFTQGQITTLIASEFEPGSELGLNNVFLTKYNGNWQLTNFNIRQVVFP
jgi:micrococcal nuclease